MHTVHTQVRVAVFWYSTHIHVLPTPWITHAVAIVTVCIQLHHQWALEKCH